MERPIQNWAKAIFFDFDYTLGDSSEAVIECMNFALRQASSPERSENEIRQTIGLPLDVIFKRFSVENIEKAETAFISRADEIMVDMTFLFKGVANVLLEVSQATQLRFGLISTKNHNRLAKILEKHALASRFKVIIGADDVENPKPAPDPILLALRKMKLNANEAIYIGDSLADAGAAKNASLPFVGVTTGTTSEAALKEAGAVYCYPNVVKALNDLVQIERATPQIEGARNYRFLSRRRLKDEVTITIFKASGPGGQHRNKVETAVRIKHLPTGVIVTATESRSQKKNREMAWRRLVEKLEAMNAPVKKRLPTKRTKSSIESRLKQKKKKSLTKKHRKPPSLDE